MSYFIDRHVVPAEGFVPRQDAACLTVELSRLGGRLDRAQQIDQQALASSVFHRHHDYLRAFGRIRIAG